MSEDQLAILAQQVEEAIRAAAAAEMPSHEVGLAILGPLRELDEVAYLRFASVYRGFESLDDFEKEIAALRAERRASGGRKMSSSSPAVHLAPPRARTPGRTAGGRRQTDMLTVTAEQRTTGQGLTRSAMESTRIPKGAR